MRLIHVSLVTLILAAATPALAQNTTTGAGANNAGMANPPARSDRDDHHDYGWIGLLGLAGLAGLMRRNDHRVVPGTTNNVSGTGTGRL